MPQVDLLPEGNLRLCIALLLLLEQLFAAKAGDGIYKTTTVHEGDEASYYLGRSLVW